MAQSLTVLLDLIDSGSLQLPEFQRGYVWNRDQVRGLMRSLYRRYPVGGLLVWQTKSDAAAAGGSADAPPGHVDLLLDGQQRITTLYGIVRGKPPAFFEGDSGAFTGLRFHLRDETFEFFSPAKMKDDPLWVDVTALMGKEGLEQHIGVINAHAELAEHLSTYLVRLTRLRGVLELEFHSEKITGEDKTIDVVVEIFDRVNSGGTKLSRADLALAKLCAEAPNARGRLRAAIATWSAAGYDFRLEWLLRVVNAVATGEAIFTALRDITAHEFDTALTRSEKAVDTLLNNIQAHLGLDHDRVLAGRYSFPVMARYLDARGGKFPNAEDRNKLLHWYVHSFLWGRYVGASETILNQDLDAVDHGGVDALIDNLKGTRGELRVHPDDFAGHTLGARFYPLLYLLTRVGHARDWGDGAPELSQAMLGKLSSLQVHHIFPKALLYAHGYSRSEVNALANYCFLTQSTNLEIGKRNPGEYFVEVERRYPGALASQWVPMDRTLWHVEGYRDFLAARRDLLAAAANEVLDALVRGATSDVPPVAAAAPEAAEDEDLPGDVRDIIDWLLARGYAKPGINREIVDPDDGRVLAVAEAAWETGLQEGVGDPILLDLELNDANETRLLELGYRAFATPSSLRTFVEHWSAQRAGTALGGWGGTAG